MTVARFLHIAYPGRALDLRDQEKVYKHCDFSWEEKDPAFRQQGVKETALAEADKGGLDVYCMRLRTGRDFVHACFLARSQDEAMARLTLIEILG